MLSIWTNLKICRLVELNVKIVHRTYYQLFRQSMQFNPLSDDKILDWSKLKQFADNNFKVDENNRKFSKQVENTVGKGEIARYEQFVLFPQCSQKACLPGASKGVIVWEWVNFNLHRLQKHWFYSLAIVVKG